MDRSELTIENDEVTNKDVTVDDDGDTNKDVNEEDDCSKLDNKLLTSRSEKDPMKSNRY